MVGGEGSSKEEINKITNMAIHEVNSTTTMLDGLQLRLLCKWQVHFYCVIFETSGISTSSLIMHPLPFLLQAQVLNKHCPRLSVLFMYFFEFLFI